MENLLVPLHGGPGFAGMHAVGGMLSTLLFALLIGFVLVRLLRTGRVGPVRFDRAGAEGGPSGTGRPGRPAGSGYPGRPGPTPEDVALATLRDRLASGDITPEEYLHRSSVLRRSTPEN